jgi:hypothetical protein
MNKIFEKRSARLLNFVTTGSLPAPATARRHQWLLHQAVINTICADAQVAATTASAPSTHQYVQSVLSSCLIMRIEIFVLFVLSSMLERCMLVFVMLIMSYIRNLIWKLSNFSTIQKPYCRHFPGLTMAGFAEALRPEIKFSGVHFKRWQVKVTLWLQAMNVFWVSNGKPEGNLTAEQQKAFTDANTIFVGCVLADRLCDVYMHITDAKELWDTLNAKFGASDAGSELYVMENFHDYKMIDNRSVVEQAHEIQ